MSSIFTELKRRNFAKVVVSLIRGKFNSPTPAKAEKWCRDAPFTERRMQVHLRDGTTVELSTGCRIKSGMTGSGRTR